MKYPRQKEQDKIDNLKDFIGQPVEVHFVIGSASSTTRGILTKENKTYYIQNIMFKEKGDSDTYFTAAQASSAFISEDNKLTIIVK